MQRFSLLKQNKMQGADSLTRFVFFTFQALPKGPERACFSPSLAVKSSLYLSLEGERAIYLSLVLRERREI